MVIKTCCDPYYIAICTPPHRPEFSVLSGENIGHGNIKNIYLIEFCTNSKLLYW
jgi:hypothetical protein